MTEKFKNYPHWGTVEKIMSETLANCQSNFPGVGVVLVDTGTSFEIEVDGKCLFELLWGGKEFVINIKDIHLYAHIHRLLKSKKINALRREK